MAQMAIYTALNIGVGLLLNAIFPTKTRNEGPRLNDLAISSSAYGRFINIPWGTQRMEGNIVWGLPIIETVSEETVSAKGGAKVTNVTYMYSGTFSIAFGLNGGTDVIRIWADGKIIYDKTDTGPNGKAALDFTFYPGGATQVIDAVEEANVGVGDDPAYRHLTRLAFNDLPLADFGNRIPSITAEVVYGPANPIVVSQTVTLIDPSFPTTYSMDTAANKLIAIDPNPTNPGFVAILPDTGTLQAIATWVPASNNNNCKPVHRLGYVVDMNSSANASTFSVYNVETGFRVGTTTQFYGQGFGGLFAMGRYTTGAGVKYGILQYDKLWFGTFINPAYISPDVPELVEQVPDLNENGFADEGLSLPFGMGINDLTFIPDDDEGSGNSLMYLIGLSGSVWQIAGYRFGSDGWDFEPIDFGTFTFPAGSGGVLGWAVHRANGYLIMSNDTSTVVYDPATASVITSDSAFIIAGVNNYPSGNVMGQGKTIGTDDAIIEIFNPLTLEVTGSIDMGVIKAQYGGSLEDLNDTTSLWDDRGGSVIVNWAGAPTPNTSVLRVFIDKAGPVNASLDDIVNDISTSYQGMDMAGLDASDIDVTGLAGEVLPGFVINSIGSARDSINALRQGFMFDGVSSDWIMKFKLHDSAPVATIPEEFVGKLTRGNDSVIAEKSSQETDLPMRVNVHYSNRAADYDVDIEHAKRIFGPVSTMYSNNEQNINLPMVFDGGTVPKQLAEKWLYTIWNGRKSYSTSIPWTYLTLDPGDLVNVGYDSGTIQIKLSEQDIGADLETRIVGVNEQTFSFSSTVDGASNLGLVRKTFAAPAPSTSMFIDAPLLRPEDFVSDAYMIGYAAIIGNADGWVGASIFKSPGGVTYVANTTSGNQAAMASTLTTPGAWVKNSAGDFPNRWQEISDGGAMTITPLSRSGAWSSATEAQVLDGANAFALVSVGITGRTVEIIQYQDATTNADGSVTLERLLRGRRGTEDVADLDQASVGDKVALLVQSDLTEENSIIYNNLANEFTGTSFLWKTVTTGIELETTSAVSFTYGGRSLFPYSVADIDPIYDSGSGDIDVTWKRRSRIVGYDNWPDDFEIPPNENGIERYNVSLENTSDVIFITKVVDDASLVTFTSAEIGAENVKNCVITTESAAGYLSPEQRGSVGNFPT